MNIPVFIINLKRSSDRRDHTIRQLNDLGITFQIIEAVDGNSLSDHDLTNTPSFGIYKNLIYSRYLLNEEIGCSLSHLKIYQKMVDEKIALACVLEDDNDYKMEFKDFFINTDLSVNNWDILYLGHHSGNLKREAGCRKKKQLKPLDIRIGEASGFPYGSYAYMLNLKAATLLLKQTSSIKSPFDRYLGNSKKLGLKIYLLSPPVAFQSPHFLSTINNVSEITYPKKFWKLVAKIKRRIYQ